MTTRLKTIKDIKHAYQNLEIAIIGNGPSALATNSGTIIDNTDLVLRMNNYSIIKDTEDFIGSKTDIYVSNLYIPDLDKTQSHLKKDNVKMIWSSIPYVFLLEHWRSDFEKSLNLFNGYDIVVPDIYHYLSLIPESIVKSSCKIILTNLIRRLFNNKYSFSWTIPTTGLVAVMMAMGLRPRKVYLTGFDFFQSSRTHYFAHNPSILTNSHHVFLNEPKILCRIISENPSTEFIMLAKCKCSILEKYTMPENFSIMCR